MSHDGSKVPARPGAATASRSVLVVEDEPAIRELVRWLLEDLGLPVETAADGADALEQGTRRRPALVVLDLNLPGLDGVSVARGLRATWGETLPILVVSAMERIAEHAQQVGAFAYLRKPFDVEALPAAVRHGLGGRPNVPHPRPS